MRLLLVLATLAMLAPLAAGQSAPIDATIRIDGDGDPVVETRGGLVRLLESAPGALYRFELRIPEGHMIVEVRANGLGLERPRQLTPSLELNETQYPLFVDLPNDRVWEVEGRANVVHVNGTGDAIVTRLAVAGPRNVTLRLEVDTQPPVATLGERQNITHIGFYQESWTDEFALADLQVRRVGASDWVQNPTPDYHVYQRFPVQGLDGGTEYETRFVFTDWAGNENITPVERFTTAPSPVHPVPTITILSPEPNATVPAGGVTVRARIDSPESPVGPEGVRLFFDLRETTEGVTFDGTEVTYTPTTALARGIHRVSIEATNELGGRGSARWSFVVGSADENGTPLPTPLAILVLALSAALARDMSRAHRQR